MHFHFLFLILATALIQLGGCVEGDTLDLEKRAEGDTIEKRQIGANQEVLYVWTYNAPDCKGKSSPSIYYKGYNTYVQTIKFPLAKSFKMSRELTANEQFDISVARNIDLSAAGSTDIWADGDPDPCAVFIRQYTQKELGLGDNCYNAPAWFTCHRFWTHG
ncbi:hypothetical protein BJX99DRAFT_263477 [Aspergillus californicus]